MKKNITIILIIGLVFIVGWFIFKTNNTEYPVEQAQEIAETWIKDNALTFTKRGGSNLTHIKTEEIAENSFEVIFDFETNFSGYGAISEDEMNAQVITPHTIIVRIKEGEVIKAITDQIFDEINNKEMENLMEGEGEEVNVETGFEE